MMINTIKSEFLKLLSVRSTYMVSIVTLAFISFLSFYIEGYWAQSGSAAATLQPLAIKEITGNSAGLIAVAISIIAVLQVGHEYRYNVIMHTLTANARRSQVFLSKVLVVVVFSVVLGLLATIISVIAYRLGLSLRDADLPAQELDIVVQVFRISVYSIIYGLFGFMLAMIVRSIIFAIVILLVLPSTIEPLLGLLLKENAKYLPISSFDHIMGVSIGQTDMTPNIAMLISLGYIGVLGIVAWVLFIRRDAN